MIAVALSFYKFSYKPKYSKNRKNKNVMLILINIFFSGKRPVQVFFSPDNTSKNKTPQSANEILLFI